MQVNNLENIKGTIDRWQLDQGKGIYWDVSKDSRLPHEDFLEMSGRLVSLIVHYGVDNEGRLTLSRKIIWPALRTIPNDTNASLSQYYYEDSAPKIYMNNHPVDDEKPYYMALDGVLTIKSIASESFEVIRMIFPAVENSAAIERVKLSNNSSRPYSFSNLSK